MKIKKSPHSHARRPCVIISDGKNANIIITACLASMIFVLAVIFSLPLVGLILEYNASISDWVLAGGVGGSACIGGYFLLKLSYNQIAPWERTIERGENYFFVRKRIFGISFTRRVGIDAVLIVSPIYQRGDWGYAIRIKSDMRGEDLIVRPTLCSSDINKAESAGVLLAGRISSLIGVPVELSEAWIGYSATAKKMSHGSD
jgi:hypothetical protein